MQQPSAIKEMRTRLECYRGRFAEIARKHRISYSWLTKFAQGKLENPTLRNLDALSATLKKLDTAAKRKLTTRSAR